MRLIDADKFECFGYDRRGNEFDSLTEAYDQGVLFVLEKIDEAPTINAQEIEHGHYYEADDGKQHCSRCGAYKIGYKRFCSYCGAKMEDEV